MKFFALIFFWANIIGINFLSLLEIFFIQDNLRCLKDSIIVMSRCSSQKDKRKQMIISLGCCHHILFLLLFFQSLVAVNLIAQAISFFIKLLNLFDILFLLFFMRGGIMFIERIDTKSNSPISLSEHIVFL